MLFLVLGLCAATSAGAEEVITWTNPAGGPWFDVSNWSPANVPDNANEVANLQQIDGAGYTVTLGDPVLTGGLRVGSKVDLNVSAPLFQIDGIPTNRGTIRLTGGAVMLVNRPLFDNKFGGTVVGGSATDTQGGTLLVAIGLDDWATVGTIANWYGGRLVSDGGDLTIRCGMMAEGTIERTSGTKAVRIQLANLQNVTNAAGSEIVVETLLDLSVENNSLVNYGTVRVPGTIQVGGFDGNASRSFSGPGEVVLEGGTLTTPQGSIVVNAAGHTIRGCGTISANLLNLGTLLSECGGSPMVIARNVTNRGVMRNLAGTLRFRGTDLTVPWDQRTYGSLTNTGTLSAEGGPVWVEDGVTIDNTGGVFTTRWPVELGRNGPCTVIGGQLEATGAGVFRNRSTTTLKDVIIGPGTLFETLRGATTIADGSALVMHGTNRIEGTFAVRGQTQYNQMGGDTQLAGGRLTASRDIQILAGELWGLGTIAGNVRNAGVLTTTPSSRGILKIQGDYRQLETGRLNLALAEDDAVLAGDQPEPIPGLQVSGAANLDGVIEATVTNGFDATLGSLLDVLSYRSVTGQFAEAIGAVPSGRLVPVYAADRLRLQVARGVHRSRVPTLVDSDGSVPVELRLYGQSGAGEACFVLDLPRQAELSVRVYDATGREVAILASGLRPPGVHRFTLAGVRGGLSNGMYFARAEIRGADGITSRTARVAVIR